jgi:MFS family permease
MQSVAWRPHYFMTEQETTRRTFHNELWRAIPVGTLDTLITTFGMLIAVRVFDMQALAKSLFIASTSGGLMMSLFVVPLLLRSRGTIASTAAKVQLCGGGAMAVSALFPGSSWLFVTGLSVGLFCMAMQIPLLTQLYRANYPAHSRGKLFSLTGTARATASMVFGLFAGWLLTLDLQNYRWLLIAFALCGITSGLLTYRLPATSWQPPTEASGSLWTSLRWIQLDRDFRTLLISWMMMGIGNLIAAALFVEYLANPKHGINLPEKDIAWIVGVIPVIFRILFSYPWGLLYDRAHFFTVRASLNVFFAAAVFVFFYGQGYWAWTIGMALFGIANAGGNVTWSLWVTKLAPQHAVAEYMSVHTFFTGFRGLIAPFIAFYLIDHVSFSNIGIACSIAILAASGFITIRARGGDTSTSSRLDPRGSYERL